MAAAGQGSAAGSQSSQSQLLASGPPYRPQHQGLGGQPTVLPDVPASAVFLALFILAAVGHMGLFQFNMHKRHKKFVFNAAIFGFCFTRIIATSLRIAWAYNPRNVSLGMTAEIFVYAGVPVLFITNLFFIQRIVRAQHPRIGWSKPFSIWVPIFVMIQILTIFLLISAVVVQFYKPDPLSQRWTRDVQIYGATLFAVAAIVPLPMVVISMVAKTHPSLREKSTDNFGEKGSISTKIILLVVTAIPLSLGAWYRAITDYLTPIPETAPTPWYFSKACFYTFNFTIEILVVLFWLAIRIDRYFIVPNGSDRPYSYGDATVFAGEYGNEKDTPPRAAGMSHESHRNLHSSTTQSSTFDRESTLPPPSLYRADSWGSVRRYMSKEYLPAESPRVGPANYERGMWSDATIAPLSPSCRYSLNPSTGNWERASMSVYSRPISGEISLS